MAQLCQGSLGDPIINRTFGSGANPGPPLAAATTTYQYVTGDCPSDGFYTVRSNTSSCFGNTWYSLSTDHTGDPSGYFMLVNASVQPSAFYLDTVRGLCSNSTYEFAAWVINVILPSSCGGSTIQPNLTFSIEKTDGSILQTYNTGSIPAASSPIWKQYGSFFTTPIAVTDIVLRIFNNSQGGCGNDLALDDITFRPCGPALTPAILGVSTTDTLLCEGTAGNFTFTCTVSGGFNNPSYQWQQRMNGGSWTDIPGQTTTTLPRSFPSTMAVGTYEYRIVVAEAGNMASLQCRIASKPLSVEIVANPVTTASNDGPVCEHTTLTLTATGGNQFAWSGPGGFTGSGSPLPLVSVQLNRAGKYYVLVTNAAGCSHKDSTTVVVEPAPIATTSFSNTTICEKDSIQLLAGGGLSYQWEPAAGLSDAAIFDPKASPAVTTGYSAIVSNLAGCKDTAFITVQVVQKPIVNAGPDKVIILGQQVQLAGSINDTGNSFSWSPPVYIDDIHSLRPIVNPPSDRKYILEAISNFGCGSTSDTMLVKVYKDIFVPNAFSPNGDNTNDSWNIPALAAYNYFDVSVYNRWGQLVFHTRNVMKPWDGTFKGKPLPMGSYNYFIDLGNSQNIYKGSLLLIR